MGTVIIIIYYVSTASLSPAQLPVTPPLTPLQSGVASEGPAGSLGEIVNHEKREAL